ncbi:MAG TPA: MarR family winged helix-turn-helix transcriptional regulator [Candidatus Dormibacteraeota bacterium]|nr:MarR family winged helix-turn-helix transcriptional regulator [Candidatus Dormibacteraeota bacterium]
MRTTPAETSTTRLWEGLTRAHHLMNAALEKDMLPEAGMPLAWFEVLHHLSNAPDGAMRFQELARTTGITDSGASRRLDQMIRAGLIERTACPTDRRGVFAHITPKGQAAYKRGHAVFIRSLRRNVTSQLEPKEIETLRSTLERLV